MSDGSTETKIILTRRDAEVVFHALEHPRPPSEDLLRAAERYRSRYGKGCKFSEEGHKKGKHL